MDVLGSVEKDCGSFAIQANNFSLCFLFFFPTIHFTIPNAQYPHSLIETSIHRNCEHQHLASNLGINPPPQKRKFPAFLILSP